MEPRDDPPPVYTLMFILSRRWTGRGSGKGLVKALEKVEAVGRRRRMMIALTAFAFVAAGIVCAPYSGVLMSSFFVLAVLTALGTLRRDDKLLTAPVEVGRHMLEALEIDDATLSIDVDPPRRASKETMLLAFRKSGHDFIVEQTHDDKGEASYRLRSEALEEPLALPGPRAEDLAEDLLDAIGAVAGKVDRGQTT